MKKHLLSLLLIVCMALPLFSCGDKLPKKPVPDGMQVAEEGNGYTFYAPVGWDVTIAGGIVTASVSAVDHSNISFVRVASSLTPAGYFTAGEDELRARLPEYTLLEEECSDNADFGGQSAICRVYTAMPGGKPYKFMQLLTARDGQIYLLTYTAEDRIPSGKVSYYNRYAEAVLNAAAAFTFEGSAPESTASDPEKNEDGLILVSDPRISRYTLLVPEGFRPDLSTGVSTAVSESKNAVVTFSGTIPEQNTIKAYWEARKVACSALYENFAVVCEQGEKDEILYRLGGQSAARYEYTFTRGGISYHTIELMTVRGVYIYTLTFTASADNFEACRTGDLNTILAHFSFK